ncbi:MAG: 3-oxoacyl-ACP synthase, partial [Treponema sp.]|nr:3-oxoacyl-ACP synthase [Treponema sp.]
MALDTAGSQDGLVKVKTHSGREFYAAKIREGALKKTSARYDMRAIQIEDAALEQIAPAVQAAKQKYGASRIAVCVGCCDNGSEFSVAGHREYFEKGAFPKNYSLE